MGENSGIAGRLALLADDLTGACDAGVQFSQCGFSTLVVLDDRPANSDGSVLLVRSSDTRNESPEVAKKKVAQLIRWVHGEKRELIFKKVDSTLRGNLGIEILTAMAELETPMAVLAPAFPAMGRTLEAGWLREEGSAAVTAVHLPTLLRNQGVRNVVHLAHSILRQGFPGFIQRFRGPNSHEFQVIVCDTSTQEDLSLVAQGALSLEPFPLIVGSAGLSSEIAKIRAKGRDAEDSAKYKTSRPAAAGRPAVLFIGSDNPVTVSQVRHLLSSRPSSHVLLAHCSTQAGRRAIESGLHIVVNIDGASDPRRIFEFTSGICEFSCAGIVLSGGDTAHRVCKALGVRSIQLLHQVWPGIPLGKIVGGVADGLPVVTKAGGFGKMQALAEVADFLAGLKIKQ
jgi:D-threonate/D-erythronate kinase